MTLHVKDPNLLQPLPSSATTSLEPPEPALQEQSKDNSLSCGLCGMAFSNLADQRSHVKSDWHGYNLKQRLKCDEAVSETDFEKLVEDLNESISGSESDEVEGDEDDNKDSTLVALLRKQARLDDRGVGNDEDDMSQRRKGGSGNPPLIWFSSTLVPTNTSFGIYRALFSESEQQADRITGVLREKQLKPIFALQTRNANNANGLAPAKLGPSIFLCMIGGGHFAAMIVSLAPRIISNANGIDERQAITLAHKTFHRYTTRRKQGGSQSANDSAKGAAHSAGAGIRRYNEAALEAEVRALLTEWKDLINASELLFVRATGAANRRTLFGPYENQVLKHNDSRNRTFPFSTRRATQAELMRAFVELTRVKTSEVDEAALAAADTAEAKRLEVATKSKSIPSKTIVSNVSKEEEAALLHTAQLQALIRRSKAPALLSYISKNALSPDFIFHPPSTQVNHHASTPLHLAASINSCPIVSALLIKGGANPAILNSQGKPPFDLAGDRATRASFRVARFEIGEEKWNWDEAHCPPPISRIEADEKDNAEKKASAYAESQRRKAELEHLKKDELLKADEKEMNQSPSRSMGINEKTFSEKREQEARGLSPEMRAKLERERRARAAEERIKRMTGR